MGLGIMPLPRPEIGLIVHYGFGAAPIVALRPTPEKIVHV
jgi:hypothetical protein